MSWILGKIHSQIGSINVEFAAVYKVQVPSSRSLSNHRQPIYCQAEGEWSEKKAAEEEEDKEAECMDSKEGARTQD